MEILYFNELESTQKYLIDRLLSKNLSTPIAVFTKIQSGGVGSRDNLWEGGEGNLFFSFAISIDKLSGDLPIGSASIYFSFIMKEVLDEFSDDIWLKWPNDIYYQNNKVGGTITKKVGDVLVCGIGINLKRGSNSYRALDIDIQPILLLKRYLNRLKKPPSWKQLFDRYAVEFKRSKEFHTHIHGEKKSFKDATLLGDGSLIIDNKRVYSLR